MMKASQHSQLLAIDSPSKSALLPLLFALLAAFLFLQACTQRPSLVRPTLSSGAISQLKAVTLVTSDSVPVAGIVSDRNTSGKVLLLHMLGSGKESFYPLMPALNLTSLAIDFRGHGETKYKPWEDFNQYDFTYLRQDARAGYEYFSGGPVVSGGAAAIDIVGASIGANIAFLLASSPHYPVKKLVLLSPGLVYQEESTSRRQCRPTAPG